MDVQAVSDFNVPESSPEQIGHSEAANPEKQNDIGGTNNKFQQAISKWRDINLSTLVPKLDATAAELVEHQKDAVFERKEVAQKTKEFRKLDDAGKLAEHKSLLKAYQTFIDLLTSHGKESSSAFLQLYTSLSEAPDPFPLLEASVESLVIAEDTLPGVQKENEELQKRVNKLLTQVEQSERQLQSESRARTELEERSSTKTREIEDLWREALKEKESNWAAKEQASEEKIENQDRLLRELKASYEVSQRMGQADNDAAMENATSAELRLVSADLEKTGARLADMEGRNEQLRVELAQARSQSTQPNPDDALVVRLQTENSGLLRKIESQRFEREAEKREIEVKVKQLERQKSSTADENDSLRTRIGRWSDYDEIKRELNMLKTIELNVDHEEGDSEDTPANGSAESGKKESLEQLLLARNRKLSNDLTLLRVSHQDMTQQLEDLREELSRTNGELEKSQKLSASLENDLLQVQEEAANALPSSGMSVAGTYTSRYPHSSSRRGRASPTSSIISGYDSSYRAGGASATLESLRSGEAVGGGAGILPMVQAQRDRFKTKNRELEDELQKSHATVTSLRQEVASLQKDNLNLYEKTRYVSAYSRGGGASSSSYGQGGPSHTSVYTAAGDNDDDDNNGIGGSGGGGRWKSQYEANISPFAAFRGREATRAYQRMSFPERVIFSLTRVVLATRASRNLFAAYCLTLHVLLFLTLYWTSAAQTATGHYVGTGSGAGSGSGTGPINAKRAPTDPGASSPGWHKDDFYQEGFG